MGVFPDKIKFKSPFGEDSSFNSDSWKVKLIQLLKECDIAEFTYQNFVSLQNGAAIIRIEGLMVAISGDREDRKFNYKILIDRIDKPETIPATPSINDIEFGIKKGLGSISDHGKQTFLRFRKNGLKIFETNHKIHPVFGFSEVRSLINNERNDLNENEWEQVYKEFKGAGCKSKQENSRQNLKDFQALGTAIQHKLANEFFKDVKVCVLQRLVDNRGRTIVSNSHATVSQQKECDVNIELTQLPDGNIQVNTILNPNLYKEHTKKWQGEANRRGLELDVENMRQTLIADLEYQINEISWFEKKQQDVEAFFDKTVGGFIEVIQSTQKVSKNIWDQGTINESIWHSKKDEFIEEHKLWPSYMQFNPYVAGTTDGIVDEIVGIPLAVKSIYEIATDSEKREALSNVFTKDGFNQLLDGIAKDIEDLQSDEEKQKHAGSKTLISVGVMFLGGAGFLSKLGKVDDAVEVVGQVRKKTEKFTDPKVLQQIDEIKKAERTVLNDKGLNKVIQEIGEEAFEEATPELLDLGENALQRGRKFTWKEVKAFFKRGNDFNRKARLNAWYPENEIWLTHPTKVYPPGHKFANEPRRFRLDSWDPKGKGKIVSRKATTLSEIKKSTFEKYLIEIKEKYPEGSIIANSDIGDKLYGKRYLEIPDINKNFDKIEEYIDLASKYKVTIIFKPE